MIETFDIETYPNYFLINTIMYESKKRTSFCIDENNNDLKKIVKWITKKDTTRVGHNILRYDNLLLKYLVMNYKYLLKKDSEYINLELKRISDGIISKKRNEPWSDELVKLLSFDEFYCIDTYAIMNTVDRVGLKQASINLKYWNVQELPYHPDTKLSQEEKDDVKEYCYNDCEISCQLYSTKIDAIKLRENVKEIYDIDATNLNDTGIAKAILDKYYSEATGINIKDFKDLRSFNKPFFIKSIIPKIEFKTKQFQDLYTWFSNVEITEKTDVSVDFDEEDEEEIKDNPISYTVRFPDLSITYGLGGIHSNDSAGHFKKTKDSKILDYDFSSYYPNIIINNNIKPRHVLKEFLLILKRLTLERIKDKKEGLKLYADIKKIIINSIYGLLGSDFYWLKDKKALITTTVFGQLWLSKFCEELLLAGINVISLNTDGILSIVNNDKEETFHKIAKSISEQINIDVELTEYKEYIRRDVNNYMSIDVNNDVKQKGKYFSTKTSLNKGYYYPILSKAINNYYTKHIPIHDTIHNSKDIYDFMSSQKIDLHKFSPELHYYDKDLILVKDKLQKYNRWIVTNSGCKFLKVETIIGKKERLAKKKEKKKKITENDLKNRIIGVEINNNITIVNKIDKDFSDYDLNYSFYEKLCNETLNMINPKVKQTTLF